MVSSARKTWHCPVLNVSEAVVIGELSRDFVRPFAVSCLFTHRNPAVKLKPMTRRESTVQHLLINCVMETEAGGDRAVGPGNRPLRGEELLVPRELRAAGFDLVLRPLKRGRD